MIAAADTTAKAKLVEPNGSGASGAASLTATYDGGRSETNGAFLFYEDHMQQGKVTPIHTHPDADEMFHVLEGEIIVHLEGGTEHRLQQGGFFLRSGASHMLS